MRARSATREPTPPPRLLLGVALLLWGGISGHPIIGLIAAVVVEAAHWTKTRWDFEERASQRAWRASLVLLLFAGAIVWMNTSIVSALPRTVVWLPITLLPLQFVQSYGIHRSLSLTSFSHFLRRRQEHAEKYGLPFRDIRFNFGHVYLVTTLTASALGEHARSAIFFPAVIILLVWAFHRSFSWKKRLAPVGAILLMAMAAAGGFGGELVLNYAYQRFVLGNMDYGSLDWARQTRTSIGDLGEIKLSPGIQWRLIPGQGELPRLVRVASYNSYLNTYWSTVLPADDEENNPLRVTGMFEELPSYGADEIDYRITAREDDDTFMDGAASSNPALPYFTLRGSFPKKGLLPIPANTASIVQESQLLEISPFGTLRLDPKHPVTNTVIRCGDPITTALPPWPDPRNPNRADPDLRIPENEQEAVARFVDELGLRDLPLQQKIRTLREHFSREFTYTRYLEKPKPQTDAGRAAFVTIFLETTKRGHCEYFATATAFILRECGVPTRYATGFSVQERDPDTGVAYLRGTHAHAWTLVWDADREKWIDVDLTPPDWAGTEAPRTAAWQSVIDWFQMLRDDLLVWRTQPGNMALAILIMVLPLALGALLVARRLWRSRRRLEEQAAGRSTSRVAETTALSDLEPLATPHIGTRQPGTPLTRWLLSLAPHLKDPDPLLKAIALHQERRFDPTSEAESLDSKIKTTVASLRQEIAELPTSSA